MTLDALFSSVLLQLCLASLGLAAPVSTASMDNSWQYGTGGGLLGLVVLILDIIVFIEVLQSSRPPMQKLVWCLVVFLFPVIGMAVYYLFSNRSAYQRGSGYEALA
ncbi:d93c6110-6b74-4a27-bdf4-d7dae8936f40 [Thermothielavioides terrestris]|uniref:D93c6110-6b74-4a27-bdf4-d7dae8936f40 n=1 Tax=Thermothielavioides terrestris TaxID=2587410 RepID=A0A3S4C9R0_9PEZI|nr:d93c6110-6b74-4a27-bdf4-d7dae8936f40 [Thermothielavioides terrestris]